MWHLKTSQVGFNQPGHQSNLFISDIYYLRANGPVVARGKKKFEKNQSKTPPGHPWVSPKNFNPIGPAV